jgi:hypothetical protein
MTTIPLNIPDALGIQPSDSIEWQTQLDGTILCRHEAVDPQRASVDVVSSILSRQ